MNKKEILDEILKQSPVHEKINDQQYRIRCPICGDSKKDPKDSHCYIKCSYNMSEPLLYNCFLCNSHGIIGRWFLYKLGIDEGVVKQVKESSYNKVKYIHNANVNVITGEPKMDSVQVRYIEDRLGTGFTYEDYDRFKIIWNIRNIKQYVTDNNLLHVMPNNRNTISFLSDDKTTMFTRTFFSSENDHQWRKLKFIPHNNYSYYIIKTSIDLFSRSKIVVNIAEGIFDIISVYKNFNDGENSVFIAALGSDYIGALDYIIMKGFVGKNIDIKVYIDQGINEELLEYRLSSYKWMFNNIYVYKNIIGKDVGERIEKIKLREKRI